MAPTLISKHYFRTLLLFFCAFVYTLGQQQQQQQQQNFLNCNSSTASSPYYHCNNSSQDQCGTFAILHTNSYYSSLFNLSFYLGLNQFVIAEANGFSAETEFLLPKNQPLLIPIDCKCNEGFFEADLTKTTIKGESFFSIVESLEGLTTCKAIQEKNPTASNSNLDDKIRLQVPLKCSCPSSSSDHQARLLVTYPVSEGDTVSGLAIQFNITPEAIIAANDKFLTSHQSLVALTSLLIPFNGEPYLRSVTQTSDQISPPKKKSRMLKVGAYIALSGVLVGGCLAIAAFVIVLLLKKKKQSRRVSKNGDDLELQQLGASVRTTTTTTNEKNKVSFEGSQCTTLDGQIVDNLPPRKILLESYSMEEIRKATDDFNSSNHIEEAVYHGRLSGKNLAIKRTKPEMISKVELQLFQNSAHHHPNIIRLLGTCFTDGPYSFLVFEYAKNGSLKDWLHGGLAIKNQFIASCYCFLTWSQRLRICLDIAMGLQYMHHVMNPSYVHRNIKTRNIFLDEEFNAKIGNFGMANCVEDDTENPQFYSANPSSWSLGYLAPEYIHERVISPSIDIFAFGVVLLEILSGQTPINRPKKKEEGSVWLSEKIKFILESESADELRDWMDNALGENYSFDAAVTLANLASACVAQDPGSRPSAGDLVEKLSRLVEELPQVELVSICESSSKPLVMAAANK